MEQLKQNGFWVGLVAVLAIIVIAFVVFVLGGMSQLAAADKDLQGLKVKIKGILKDEEAIPSEKQVQTCEQRSKDLAKELADCKAWYKQYDDALEAWFPEVPNNPQPGDFKAVYDTKRKGIEEQLAAAQIHIGIRPAGDGSAGALFGGGAVAGGLRWEPVDAPGSPSIKDIQKRYWIRARIVNALLKIQQDTGGKGVFALEDTSFPTDKGGKNEDYPGWSAMPCELPGKYGHVILCGIRVEMSNAHVPKFLKLLLEPNDPEPRLLTHIRGVRTTLTEAMPEKYEETIQYNEGENPATIQKKKEEELNAKLNRPKPIRVFVTYEVFDFDGEKLVKPFTPPPATP
jgi:hypothetical protein